MMDSEEGRRRKMLGAQIHISTAFNQVGARKSESKIVGSSLGWDGWMIFWCQDEKRNEKKVFKNHNMMLECVMLACWE